MKLARTSFPARPRLGTLTGRWNLYDPTWHWARNPRLGELQTGQQRRAPGAREHKGLTWVSICCTQICPSEGDGRTSGVGDRGMRSPSSEGQPSVTCRALKEEPWVQVLLLPGPFQAT